MRKTILYKIFLKTQYIFIQKNRIQNAKCHYLIFQLRAKRPFDFDSINGAASRYLERRYVRGAVTALERRSRNIIGKRYWKNKNDSREQDSMQINNCRYAQLAPSLCEKSERGGPCLAGYLLTEGSRSLTLSCCFFNISTRTQAKKTSMHIAKEMMLCLSQDFSSFFSAPPLICPLPWLSNKTRIDPLPPPHTPFSHSIHIIVFIYDVRILR